MLTVTPCITTQTLNTDGKEIEHVRIFISRLIWNQNNFTIYMKVLDPTHNLPHAKCSTGTKISNMCGGKPLEYNAIIIHPYSLFHFTVYSE
jgi:hypothetical protein